MDAFETFSMIYPHEAYAAWPERFWLWFHDAHSDITREEMETILKESENTSSVLTDAEMCGPGHTDL